MVKATKVTLKPINYRLNVQRDPDFLKYIKGKLLGVPLSQGKKIELSMLDAFLPFFVEKTEPEGEVTITENTDLEVVHEFMRVGGGMTASSQHTMGEMPDLLAAVDLLVNALKDLEKRLYDSANKFENLMVRLEKLGKKLEEKS